MTIDLTPVIQALVPLALAAITAGVPVLLRVLQQKNLLTGTAQQQAAILNAAKVGADYAYGVIAAQGATLANIPVKNAALAIGVNHVLASVPQSLTALGITPEHVSAMVDARLHGLLVPDPAVTIVAPTPQAPAPAQVAAQ